MHIIKICTAASCTQRFSLDSVTKAEKLLGIKAGETTPDGKFRLEKVGCLSHCELGPNVMFLSQSSPLTLIMNQGAVENKMFPSRFEEKLQSLIDQESPKN